MNSFKKYVTHEVLHSTDRFFVYGVLKRVLAGSPQSKVLMFYRLAKMLHNDGYHRIASLLFSKLQKDYAVYIGPRADIDLGLKLPHPTGIVIGDGARIGKNATIYQQVTIGGARIGDAGRGAYPVLGDDCVVFSGAKLLGQIRVGNKCTIGANAVVIKDVPDGRTAVGVPARLV